MMIVTVNFEVEGLYDSSASMNSESILKNFSATATPKKKEILLNITRIPLA